MIEIGKHDHIVNLLGVVKQGMVLFDSVEENGKNIYMQLYKGLTVHDLFFECAL